jgi:hypothetical protein
MTDGADLLDSSGNHQSVLAIARDEGQSYDEIATRLQISPDIVRERAHLEGDALVGDEADPPPADARARIVDYVLGQQPAFDRARTWTLLEASQLARDWAQALTAALAGGLPATAAPTRTVAEARTDAEARRDAEEGTEPAGPERRRSERIPSRRALAITGLLWVTIAAIALAVVLASRGSDTHRAATGARAERLGARGPAAKTLQRLVLEPSAAHGNGLGAGAVVQQDGSTLLLIEGRGLAPNNHNSYAVWLYNTPVDSRLLGFISPAVGSAGTFSSGTQLPDDAVRFGQVLITLESSSDPSRPGQVVLHSPLSLG